VTGERTDTANYTLSVLIPVYNERATIEEIVARVQRSPIPKQVVVVDDGSTDGTVEIVRSVIGPRYANLTALHHAVNRGKGAAIRTGIPACTGDFIVIQDADLEYDPADLPTLLQPLLDGRADVVFGTRFVGGAAHRVHLYWHRLGNGILTTLSNMMTNLNLTDMEAGYKAFRAEVLKSIHLRSNRFGFEPEITAKVARRKCRIYEVPVSYSGRDYDEGKKIGWRDGLAALWTIVRYRIGD